MLPRQRRIRTRREYYHVFRGRKIARGRILVVQGIPNSIHRSRYGFVVGTVVSKKATDRNRIKRQLRHLVLTVPNSPVHWDIVVRVLPGAAGKNKTQLRQEFFTLYNQLTHDSHRRLAHQRLPKNNLTRPRPVAA